MPTTVFLALQCCQCSTMQVKQQKKSSNKWTCVVCNQKQSVRKVFAQGFMAKDVRKFVQSFNMSRQLAEQNLFPVDEQKDTLEIENQLLISNRKEKRTDWTEYIEPEEDCRTTDLDENPGDEFVHKIVTEMPKPVFKKPKLKNYRIALDCEDGDEKTSMMDFGETHTRRKRITQAVELSLGATVRGKQQERTDYAAAMKGNFEDTQEVMKLELPICGMNKWKGCLTEDDNVKFANEVPRRNQLATAKGERSSKWSCYMTEEDGDLQAKEWNDQHGFETEFIDQRVEEDIHPDFL